jgi:hypothetical protein
VFSNSIVWKTPNHQELSTANEVSGSGQFLYQALGKRLYQYDLWSDNIYGSRVLVDTFDGLLHLGVWEEDFNDVQRGPDCRLYMKGRNGVRRIGVVMYPDRKGKDCEVRQHIIDTGCYMNSAWPYFPNYRLDTEYPVCDSTIQLTIGDLTSLDNIHPVVNNTAVWPNPFTDKFKVDWAFPLNNVTIKLIDIFGQVVATHVSVATIESHTFEQLNLPTGSYVLEVTHLNQIISRRQIICIK